MSSSVLGKGKAAAAALSTIEAIARSAWEPKPFFKFEVLHRSTKQGSRARVGVIHTPHGKIQTPGFVPVATNGAIKSVPMAAADDEGCELMFMNCYHLLLRPGPDVVSKAGGLHRFTNRTNPIITDSGGFQIFSHAAGAMDLPETAGLKGAGSKKRPNLVLKVNEEGVIFRSYVDGAKIELTPERSVQVQKQLGADIIIPLDEVLPFSAPPDQFISAYERTHRWELRSLVEHLESVNNQAMYSVVHGGLDVSLRKKSINFLASLPFDGMCIGGSLGKTKDDLKAMLAAIAPEIPTSLPTHLLGIADVESITSAASLGLDTFDSCYPTRLARHGTALVTEGKGKINIRRSVFANDFSNPLDPGCTCHTCKTHSRAYIRHLCKAHEPTADTLITIHNIRFMNDTMGKIRQRILANDL